MLKREGISGVLDEYWLREGEKEANERIYDKTKWLVPVIALYPLNEPHHFLLISAA